MALGARNRADAANRPPPQKTRLDELKEKIKDLYVVHKDRPVPSSGAEKKEAPKQP